MNRDGVTTAGWWLGRSKDRVRPEMCRGAGGQPSDSYMWVQACFQVVEVGEPTTRRMEGTAFICQWFGHLGRAIGKCVEIGSVEWGGGIGQNMPYVLQYTAPRRAEGSAPSGGGWAIMAVATSQAGNRSRPFATVCDLPAT